MKKLISIFLMFAIGISLSGQVPQRFNYQAVARELSGQAITNSSLSIRIGILSDTITPVLVWEEEHVVNTNSLGLFTLTIGDPNATKTGGSVSSFDDINWSGSALFIQTSIDYDGWYDLGYAQLWSVPYAMISDKSYKDLSSPFLFNDDTVYIMNNLSIGSDSPMKAKLSVTGTDDLSEDALFEVKRADGQTVFAVYSEGVRVFLPTVPETKGPKGGFAIGGFDRTKGEYTEDYLWITPDSIRMYIDKTPDGKGPKGGFAIGGFDRTKTEIDDYLIVNADSTRIYIDDTGLKGPKGGFAIGGFDRTKGYSNEYMRVTRDSIRVYIDTVNNSGGFAVSNQKSSGSPTTRYLNVQETKTNIYSKAKIQDQEFTSWNLLVDREDDTIDTIKLLSSSYNVLSMSIPYNDFAKGVETRFEVKSGITSEKGLNTNILSIGTQDIKIGLGAGDAGGGIDNIFIGQYTGHNQLGGADNIYIGRGSGYYATGGADNIFIGNETGWFNISGNRNVFIGNGAGTNEIGSDRLYIENSNGDSTTALIYGEFDNDILAFNAQVGIGTINPMGTLDVNGSIYQRGTLLHADYVFKSGYNLESIDDHSEFMWKNKHLPAVPKAWKDENGNDTVEFGSRNRGVLEELEKAHVYIEQLHNKIKLHEKTISEKDKEIQSIKIRLDQIESLLGINPR